MSYDDGRQACTAVEAEFRAMTSVCTSLVEGLGQLLRWKDDLLASSAEVPAKSLVSLTLLSSNLHRSQTQLPMALKGLRKVRPTSQCIRFPRRPTIISLARLTILSPRTDRVHWCLAEVPLRSGHQTRREAGGSRGGFFSPGAAQLGYHRHGTTPQGSDDGKRLGEYRGQKEEREEKAFRPQQKRVLPHLDAGRDAEQNAPRVTF